MRERGEIARSAISGGVKSTKAGLDARPTSIESVPRRIDEVAMKLRHVLMAAALAAVAAPASAAPDFSGIWAHPWLPGFEALPSGPTALVNLTRRNGASVVGQLVGDYHNPILKPEAAETVRKLGEQSKAH